MARQGGRRWSRADRRSGRAERPRGSAASLVGLVLAVAIGATACSRSESQDDALRRRAAEVGHPIGSSTTAAPTSTTEAGGLFSRRLAAVRVQELVLGDAFNRQFLSVQLRAVGFDESQAGCVVDRVAAAAGDGFATQQLGSLGSGVTPSPDVLLACVPADRIAALARSPRPDLSRVPADTLRSTLMTLAVAGYEAAGLEADEADCVAQHVVGTYSDKDLISVMGDLSLPADRSVAAIRTCVTADRASQLGA